jgi:uncharacterized protein (TIGR02453 family)
MAAPRAARAARFSPALFGFLEDLAAHNDRAWFHAHKARYEADVKGPLLAFITDFGPRLAAVSPRFTADPRPVGGSMFRIHRDTRFARDKRPYKTHAAAQFRHEAGRDVHAPCFYLHLAPGEVFAGAGLWRPDGATLKAVRDTIDAWPDTWGRVKAETLQGTGLYLDGDALKRPPRGYDPEHPAIDDLRRKDFIVVRDFTQADACRADFLDRFADACRAAAPFVRFLTQAGDLPF